LLRTRVRVRETLQTFCEPKGYAFVSRVKTLGKLRIPENISTDDPLYQIQFEVQVPSAFEHAWSVTTHALTYKGEHVEWNRFRLAAQLKAAVEQLDILILAFEETSSKISKNSWPETQAKTKLSGYFKEKFASGVLPGELYPQDWTRFSDNVYDMVRSPLTVKLPFWFPVWWPSSPRMRGTQDGRFRIAEYVMSSILSGKTTLLVGMREFIGNTASGSHTEWPCYNHSSEADTDAAKRDSRQFGRPRFAD
jgi:hypothetical protein